MLAAVAASPLQARSETVQEFLVRELRAQGFEPTLIRTTWLGRLQIIAVNAVYRREIIANPRTGEILRDYWRKIGEGQGLAEIIDPGNNSGSGSSSGKSSGGQGSGGHTSGDDHGSDGDHSDDKKSDSDHSGKDDDKSGHDSGD
jgi:uncharacterized membrane protein YgcG